MRLSIVALICLLCVIPIVAQDNGNDIDWTISDFVPPIGAAESPQNNNDGYGPWNRRILIAISEDDGWTWERTGQNLSDQADYPTAVITPDGRIFVYFITYHAEIRNQIVAAISDDFGETWVYKRVTFDFPQPPVDPSAIVLDDGSIRMFFNQSIERRTVAIYSATSEDGLNFILDSQMPHLADEDSHILAPTIFRFDNGYHLYAINPQGANYHALSEDGLSFTSQTDVVLEERHFIAQGQLALDNGFRVFTFTGAPAHDGFFPSIHSYITTDGFTWEREDGTRLVYDGQYAYESVSVRNPAVIRLPDDRILMFYITVIPEPYSGS
ncbi:MAG: hypothetical protein D6712_17020 [Chloroflexi bacterium]|nr:MAG: hypothetical protein D6712_17020 [Chloroflexota bacterium]